MHTLPCAQATSNFSIQEWETYLHLTLFSQNDHASSTGTIFSTTYQTGTVAPRVFVNIKMLGKYEYMLGPGT
jgi:hypothetical protein